MKLVIGLFMMGISIGLLAAPKEKWHTTQKIGAAMTGISGSIMALAGYIKQRPIQRVVDLARADMLAAQKDVQDYLEAQGRYARQMDFHQKKHEAHLRDAGATLTNLIRNPAGFWNVEKTLLEPYGTPRIKNDLDAVPKMQAIVKRVMTKKYTQLADNIESLVIPRNNKSDALKRFAKTEATTVIDSENILYKNWRQEMKHYSDEEKEAFESAQKVSEYDQKYKRAVAIARDQNLVVTAWNNTKKNALFYRRIMYAGLGLVALATALFVCTMKKRTTRVTQE